MRVRVASLQGVAESWKRQYVDKDPQWPLASGKSPKDIYDALLVAKTPDEAAAIIGNQSWTHPYCAGCQTYADVAAEFGDSETTTLCGTCLMAGQAAVAAVKAMR